MYKKDVYSIINERMVFFPWLTAERQDCVQQKHRCKRSSILKEEICSLHRRDFIFEGLKGLITAN